MRYLLALTIALLCSCSQLFSQAVENQVIVQLSPAVAYEKFAQEYGKTSAPQILKASRLGDWNVWLLNLAANEQLALETVKGLNGVVAAQLNHKIQLRSTTPNDAGFSVQWNLQNTGQNGGLIGADVQATDAWDIGTGGLTVLGDTIVIAIVDGGIDLNHADLNIWRNPLEIAGNNVDDDNNGYIDDINGWNADDTSGNIVNDYHGTHVAGIAGAIGNNSLGVSGVCWDTKIMPIVVSDYTDWQVMSGYKYIFDVRKRYNITNGTEGAFVVAANSSFGVDFGNPADYPLWCAFYDSLGKVGVLSTIAVPNAPTDVDAAFDMPTSCSSNYMIAVTNTTRFDVKNSTAGYGASTVDIAAPGTGVYSTTPGGNFGNSTGTSMASPHLAGAMALLMSVACDSFMLAYKADPANTVLAIKAAILNSADILPSLSGTTVSGGRLNLYRSIQRFINDNCVNCVKVEPIVNTISCKGARNGSISLQISDGLPPYTITWLNGSSDTLLANLAPGTYTVNVTDSLGCSKDAFITIDEPEELLAAFSVSRESNFNQDGAIDTDVYGGTAPYNFAWSGPDTLSSQNIAQLSAGTYFVTITDANGCQFSDSVLVQRDTTSSTGPIPNTWVKVFPIPSSGNISIIADPLFQNAEWEVMDLFGRKMEQGILQGDKQILPLESLPKGTYLLRLRKGDDAILRKIVLL
ncbi:MAG: S8 family serine peptidase [Chitinophagales bacterium]|nr:S8 family serine peptidase [Chitinophagales bacterium]